MIKKNILSTDIAICGGALSGLTAALVLQKLNLNILIIDPRNFMWLGYIKLIFPNAKIIHCVRNPLDNCLSLYKNFFVGGVDFSFDLTELGQYYKLYLDLMEFWKKLLPNYYTNIL